MPTKTWAIRFFRRHPADDSTEESPAARFLRECPPSVATDLLSILDAVALSPPPSFSGGGMWESMHGDMAGFFEARTRGPGRRLFRLFCLLERDVLGLQRPAIVVIAGMAKPVGSAFSRQEYERVRRLADEYRSRTPRSLA